MDTLIQPTQLNISSSENPKNSLNIQESIENNNNETNTITKSFKKLFQDISSSINNSNKKTITPINNNSKNNNNNSKNEIVNDKKETTAATNNNVNRNHNYIIVKNNNSNTPMFKSQPPDLRLTVNGFPNIQDLKRKEYQWFEQLKALEVGQNDNNYPQYHNDTISKLVLLGIPKRIRGYIWRLTSGSIELEKKNIGVYQYFLTKTSEEYEYKISKDISRTFPNIPYFCAEEGQSSLFNILKAYSIMDPEIGYTQGMSFIAAVLLSEMDELESFWVFTCIMKNYKLSTLYCDDLGLLRQYLYVIDRLIETTMPKLFSHLKEIGVTPVLFASEWISTLFTYNFDIKISKRLLDVFFIEGRFYLHKLSCSILKTYEKQLLSMEFEDAVEFLKRLGYQIDPDALLKVADSMTIPLQLIESFEAEFVHPNAPSDYF